MHRTFRTRGWLVGWLGLAAVLAACDPFGLPSTRALENGAAAMLNTAPSYEMAGTYTASNASWSIDLQTERSAPPARHLTVSSAGGKVEAIIIGSSAYFRGKDFLASHLKQANSQVLISAAGSAWWKGSVGLVPYFPDLTNGDTFRATFLGQAVTTRTDHQTVNGEDAVDLSGARADVYIASTAPYDLLRVRLKTGVVVDGISDADFYFSNVGSRFGITAPTDVIDFSNASSLPPIYTVVSVDTSQCNAPCVVSATVKNLGGATGASAPSSVKFTMTDTVSRQSLDSCTATISPDVGYNSTTSVTCTIPTAGRSTVTITAVADNPGHG